MKLIYMYLKETWFTWEKIVPMIILYFSTKSLPKEIQIENETQKLK